MLSRLCGQNGLRALSGEHLVLAALTLYVLGLCLFPLLRLVAELADPNAVQLVQNVLTGRSARLATWHTIEASLGATIVSLVLGVSLALVLGLVAVPGRSFLVFLVLVPMLVPAQIAALAWLELTGPSSVVLKAIGLAPPPGTRNWLYSREGIVLLMGIEHMPIVFIAVRASLRNLPAELIEAARIAGSGWLTVLSSIILPLLRLVILASGGLVFAAAVGNFGIPTILGIPGRYTMLTALVYQRLSGFGPSILGEVAILSIVLALIAGVGLMVQVLLRRSSLATLTGSGKEVAPLHLGRAGYGVTAAVLFVLIPASILPVLALLGTSLVQALGLPLNLETVTLQHYATVWENDSTRRALVNSAYLSLAAAAGALIVSVPFAWQLVFRRSRIVRTLNVVVDAPYALPGIVISICFILAFLQPLPIVNISLYNTAWIILIAYLARFFALGLRPVVAAMEVQDPALEEAAQIAGAGPLQRLRSILLPQVAPAAGAGILLIVMSAYNELTVSALLWSQGNETVGVLVFNLYDEGDATAAAAASVIAVFVTFAAAALATLLARWLPKGVLPWQN